MQIPTGKKIYFASDFHLGAPNFETSLVREKKITSWLDSIKKDAFEIYLVGDVFDFWFEYKTVVPKGFVRLQGKIAELTDSGIKIYYITGNHDMWAFGYFNKELGVELHKKPIEKSYNNKTFFIGHGDGLGPSDKGYKFIKKIFSNSFCQWAFARLHPNFGVGLANYFSTKSRIANGINDEKFLGEENEWLIQYCKEKINKTHFDFFIFGHRHLPLDIKIKNSRYINLGEWISYCSFAEFDGENLILKNFVTK